MTSYPKRILTACMFAALHGCALADVCKSSLHPASDAAKPAPVFPRSRGAAEAIANAERFDGQRVRATGYISADGAALVLDGDFVPIPLRSAMLLWGASKDCWQAVRGHRVEMVGKLSVLGFNWDGAMHPMSFSEVSEVVILN